MKTCQIVMLPHNNMNTVITKYLGSDDVGNLYNSVFLQGIPEQFIQEYVDSYNNGDIITI